MRLKNTFKRSLFIILTLILLPLFVFGSGYSSWYIIIRDAYSNSSAAASAPTRTVNFYYYTTYTQATSTSSNTEETGSISEKSSTTFSYNNISYGITYSSLYSSYSSSYPATPIKEVTNVNGNTKTVSSFYLTSKVTRSGWLLSYKYSFSFKIVTTVTVTTYTTEEGLVEEDGGYKLFHTATVPNGSLLKKPNLTYTGYKLVGFYYYDNNNILGESVDFSKDTFTANTNIIVKWVPEKTDNDTSGTTSLASAVASLGTGTLNVYQGSPSYNIINDYTYCSTSKALNLGDGANVTLNGTLNLAMNSGIYHKDALNDGAAITDPAANMADEEGEGYSTDTTVALNNNTRDYTVKLQNDLTINGTLNVGGYTGSGSNSKTNSEQGYIIGNYVTLDLNGHNITINSGGTLHSFGYITDSVGTGKITVNTGGNLLTPIVIYDLKGGNSSLWNYAKGICPFENYTLPYLDTTVDLKVSGSSAGNLTVFTKLNLGDLGFVKFYMPLIGSGNYIFNISSATTGTVNFHTEEIAALSALASTTLANKRNVFTFNNLDVTLSKEFSVSTGVHLSVSVITVNQAFDLYFDKFAFPVSSLFDMNFVSSTFTLSQKMVLHPGANWNMDANSKLIFDYYKNSSGAATQRKFDNIPVKYLGITLATLPSGESKYLSGGITALSTPPHKNSQSIGTPYGLTNANNTAYWNYFEQATVNIFGLVVFTAGNNAPYTLSGNINANRFSTATNGAAQAWNVDNLKNNGVNLQTYDLTAYSSVSFWFNGDSINPSGLLSGNAISNNNAYVNFFRFYTDPMINNGVAYVIDGTNAMTGSWNNQTGVFSTSENNYFFLSNNSALVDSTNTESPIDYTIIPTACTASSNKSMIAYNNQDYIYFGGLYFPATVSGTSATANLTKFSTKNNYSSQALTYSNGYWKINQPETET